MQLGPLSFFGEQELRVDPQGRISIPTRFRDAFKGGIVLTRSFDRCIAAYTPGHWETFASEVATRALNRIKNRRLRRVSFSAAYNLEADRQGRVLLPASLRRYAQIGEEVVIAGMGDFLEIWDKEAWLQESAFLEEEASLIAEITEEHP
ncbi:MAG: division/cell wall cluster transcriptional repressor MraZ [Chloroflexi bacterium]|nr:division/cell wall cluster transcriptional repressor MraZ [Chloroflexota bacterium]